MGFETLPNISYNQPEQETEKTRQFNELFERSRAPVEEGSIPVIEYNLPYPKEDFFSFLVEEKNVLLHGSPHENMNVLEPRQANDSSKQFGNKEAVYAVTDPVLPIFYAIQDRTKLGKSVIESGFIEDDETNQKDYIFKIHKDKNMTETNPWKTGVVYIVERSTFSQGTNDQGSALGEWASETPVKPIAKLEVSPEDFRFLNKVIFTN